jgi:hypothetical protein
MVLLLLNRDRARVGLSPLHLSRLQSSGRRGCAGSYGHSLAMAQTGYIWHANPAYPHASFPNNICVSAGRAAQNAGRAWTGNHRLDLQVMNALMINEAHDPATCADSFNHACNILKPAFDYVGIGIYFSRGSTWLTEDFLGRQNT